MPLFLPIIRHYRSAGVSVILTARDHAQTIELLRLAGMDGRFAVIGKHYGKGAANKVRGLLVRAVQLAKYIRRQGKPAVAVSHGSRSMVLAARLLRVPVITMYDYEHTETGIFNRLSDKVLVPDAIPESVLDRIGLPRGKRVRYAGIKEELYVHHFVPDPDFWPDFQQRHGPNVASSKVIAVIRPPASTANYHAAKSDELFKSVLARLLPDENVFSIISPRTPEQRTGILDEISRLGIGTERYRILDSAEDGLNLLCDADLVISGGGTMNREAVLLGVPVYSIFQGTRGSLDAEMERTGQMTFLHTPDDVRKIAIAKKPSTAFRPPGDRVELFVTKQIDCFLDRS